MTKFLSGLIAGLSIAFVASQAQAQTALDGPSTDEDWQIITDRAARLANDIDNNPDAQDAFWMVEVDGEGVKRRIMLFIGEGERWNYLWCQRAIEWRYAELPDFQRFCQKAGEADQ